jgi:sialate O-acetylesterase
MVATPVAVRYAFKDFIVGELFSVEGYPVSSF